MADSHNMPPDSDLHIAPSTRVSDYAETERRIEASRQEMHRRSEWGPFDWLKKKSKPISVEQSTVEPTPEPQPTSSPANANAGRTKLDDTEIFEPGKTPEELFASAREEAKKVEARFRDPKLKANDEKGFLASVKAEVGRAGKAWKGTQEFVGKIPDHAQNIGRAARAGVVDTARHTGNAAGGVWNATTEAAGNAFGAVRGVFGGGGAAASTAEKTAKTAGASKMGVITVGVLTGVGLGGVLAAKYYDDKRTGKRSFVEALVTEPGATQEITRG